MADVQLPLTVATHDLRPPSPRAVMHVLSPEEICDVSVVERTNNFYYDDQSVLIKVEDEAFKVSRSRLSALSPVLRAMLAPTHQQLQTPTSASWAGMKIVEFSQDSAQDVRDFLWYIHADGLTVLDFVDLEPSNFKCGRLIGIATVAFKYEAMREAHWAVRSIFEMLEVPTGTRKVTLNPATLARLHRLATRYAMSDAVKRTREIWADIMYDCGDGPAGEAEDHEEGMDPVGMLMAAKEVGDEWLMGLAYYFVLRLGDERLDSEPRLTAEDGRRLLVGARKLLLLASGWAASSAAGTRPGSPLSVSTPILSHPASRESSPGPSTPTESPVTPRRRRSLVLRHKFYARIPDEIAPIRDQLWAMFTSNPWKLC